MVLASVNATEACAAVSAAAARSPIPDTLPRPPVGLPGAGQQSLRMQRNGLGSRDASASAK
ncbi:hypothetical protein NIIDMKKI_02420 [Mycobacterium kansasii]|uniref:Uncharacterized protein n=1 Tax=Mycobacterium kansasii TaxID=1768 RepID=A0A7G1I1V6_MYCKA|nr:hypothetical protein NIIDMKKI_02420 [Mycobacterium kansasii]